MNCQCCGDETPQGDLCEGCNKIAEDLLQKDQGFLKITKLLNTRQAELLGLDPIFQDYRQRQLQFLQSHYQYQKEQAEMEAADPVLCSECKKPVHECEAKGECPESTKKREIKKGPGAD